MKKRVVLLTSDAVLVGCAYFFAYLISIELKNFHLFYGLILQTLPLLIFCKCIVFFFSGMYQPLWRYASLNALMLMIRSVFLASTVVLIVFYFLDIFIPRSVAIVDGMLSFLLVGASRLWIRLYQEWFPFSYSAAQRALLKDRRRRPILIYGANDAGEQLLREMRRNPDLKNYQPVGFIDDFKQRGQKIHNVSILGSFKDLPTLIRRYRIEELIIALSNIGGEKMREIVHQCRACGIRFKVIPRLGDIVTQGINGQLVRDVDVKDLLKRAPQELDTRGIQHLIAGKRIMITGGGGSIGGELSLQVASWKPDELILVDSAENNLHTIRTRLNDVFPQVRVSPFLTSVTHTAKLRQVFLAKRPHLVFHAAAFKHVPLCEENFAEAIRNNVEGTLRTAALTSACGAEKFIFISTDKAVNPCGIMGVTKRIGELIVNSINAYTETAFSTVRFGNVLESSGSVIPRFCEQIRAGGPVTVTDPRATRYLMLLSEAVQLILHAAATGKGGEIFVLDMGEPIKIVEIAKDLITLMGFRPDVDIRIEYTSLRPGEKLHEQLCEDSSDSRYIHPHIMMIEQPSENFDALLKKIRLLLDASSNDDLDSTIRMLKAIVPNFSPIAASEQPMGELQEV